MIKTYLFFAILFVVSYVYSLQQGIYFPHMLTGAAWSRSHYSTFNHK